MEVVRGVSVAWRDIERESWLIRGWGMEAVDVVLMSRVGKAWDVRESHRKT